VTAVATRQSLRDRVNRELVGAVERQPEAWAARFAGAQPFPHLVIDNFLALDFCDDICAQFPPFAEAAALNEDGVVGQKATQEKVRELGPAYLELDDLVQSKEFLGLVEKLTGIENLQYDPWYFGGGTHDNRHGQDLDPHVDFNYHPITRQHRRLNLIVYLNEEWEGAWGGSLQLHRDPRLPRAADEVVTVPPALNRCVIFETSERSWHGFERIDLPAEKQHLSRRSFALYFYTKSRPAEQIALAHSTIYVERHLPERFAPGYTLGDDDVRELRRLLSRRDQHLARLYREVQRLLAVRGESLTLQIAARLASKAYAFERATSIPVTPPLRALWRLLRRGRRDAGTR
jgi:hypothetical protein